MGCTPPGGDRYTVLTLGCWVSASILDLAGGRQARHSDAIMAGAGFLGGHLALNLGTARRGADGAGPLARVSG